MHRNIIIGILVPFFNAENHFQSIIIIIMSYEFFFVIEDPRYNILNANSNKFNFSRDSHFLAVYFLYISSHILNLNVSLKLINFIILVRSLFIK